MGRLLTHRGRLVPRGPGRGTRGLLVLAVAVALAACGTGSTTASSGPTGTVFVYGHVPQPAGPNPSGSARMICAAEVQGELAYALGVKPVGPVRPTWVDHLYSCRYVYRNGVLALSVKELSSQAETTAWFDADKQKLGDTAPITGLGQGGFVTSDGSVVVRKDYKVLFIDVAGLPPSFGSPATSRADVAITAADVVMACWSGS
jgi:hypothetical protein